MNKNKRGQLQAGGYVLLIIGIIVVLTLIIASAQQIGTVKDTYTYENVSIGTLTNGTPTYITDCRAIVGTVRIFNATGDLEMASGNYTLTNNVLYNGMWAVQIDPNVTVTAGTAYNKGLATIDGTCEPITYSENNADKTVLDLIILLSGLALLVWVLEASGVINLFGRE
jgi:hypothetical protein